MQINALAAYQSGAALKPYSNEAMQKVRDHQVRYRAVLTVS